MNIYECENCGRTTTLPELPEGWEYVQTGLAGEDLALLCDRCLQEDEPYEDDADEYDDFDYVDITGEQMDIAWDLQDEPTPDDEP